MISLDSFQIINKNWKIFSLVFSFVFFILVIIPAPFAYAAAGATESSIDDKLNLLTSKIQALLDGNESFYKISTNSKIQTVGLFADCSDTFFTQPGNDCVFSVDSIRIKQTVFLTEEVIPEGGIVPEIRDVPGKIVAICVDSLEVDANSLVNNCSPIHIETGEIAKGNGLTGSLSAGAEIPVDKTLQNKLNLGAYVDVSGEWENTAIQRQPLTIPLPKTADLDFSGKTSGGNVLTDEGFDPITATKFVIVKTKDIEGEIEFTGTFPSKMRLILGNIHDGISSPACNDKSGSTGCPQDFVSKLNSVNTFSTPKVTKLMYTPTSSETVFNIVDFSNENDLFYPKITKIGILVGTESQAAIDTVNSLVNQGQLDPRSSRGILWLLDAAKSLEMSGDGETAISKLNAATKRVNQFAQRDMISQSAAQSILDSIQSAIVKIENAAGDDNIPPTIGQPDDITVQTDESAVIVNYAIPGATDDTDPAPTVMCIPASGSLFPLGETLVTCTATDSSGNSSQSTFTVTVEDSGTGGTGGDTTPPTIGQPENIMQSTTDESGIVVNYATPVATDDTDPAPSVVCIPAPGTLFPIGNTIVTCTATDSSGNSNKVMFAVSVKNSATSGMGSGDDILGSKSAQDVTQLNALSISAVDGIVEFSDVMGPIIKLNENGDFFDKIGDEVVEKTNQIPHLVQQLSAAIGTQVDLETPIREIKMVVDDVEMTFNDIKNEVDTVTMDIETVFNFVAECPPGTTTIGVGPAALCTVEASCPLGTENLVGICTAIPVPSCPNGGTPIGVGAAAVCTETASCSFGDNVAGTCTEGATPDCSAFPGLTLNQDGTLCTAQSSCSFGTNAAGTCTEGATPDCSAFPGLTLNQDGTLCTAQSSCPDSSFTNTAGTCTKPSSKTCDPDYSVSGLECATPTICPPSVPGFPNIVRDGFGGCSTFTFPTTSCPPGSFASGIYCLKTTNLGSQPSCPDGHLQTLVINDVHGNKACAYHKNPNPLPHVVCSSSGTAAGQGYHYCNAFGNGYCPVGTHAQIGGLQFCEPAGGPAFSCPQISGPTIKVGILKNVCGKPASGGSPDTCPDGSRFDGLTNECFITKDTNGGVCPSGTIDAGIGRCGPAPNCPPGLFSPNAATFCYAAASCPDAPGAYKVADVCKAPLLSETCPHGITPALGLCTITAGCTSGENLFGTCTDVPVSSCPNGGTPTGVGAAAVCTATASCPSGENLFGTCTDVPVSSCPNGGISTGVGAAAVCTETASCSFGENVLGTCTDGAVPDCSSFAGTGLNPDKTFCVSSSACPSSEYENIAGTCTLGVTPQLGG